MLSYRHAFHAGNHADVLKHFVFSQVLQYFNQKEKPYWVVDTHAGAGMYELNDTFAQKNGEFENGILRLKQAKNLSPELQTFIDCIDTFKTQNSLNFYPGSPKIAEYFCRKDDKLRLFELHPSDFKLLAENFSAKKRQTNAAMQDGFDGIKACLPPPTKRAIVLIDPPYELKEDYLRVVDCIKDCLKRFSTGSYLIWYPLLQRPEPMQMIDELQKLGIKDWLNVTLTVQNKNENGFGMFGSGMFIINPPWTMPKFLQENMPTLTEILALDAHAAFELNYAIT